MLASCRQRPGGEARARWQHPAWVGFPDRRRSLDLGCPLRDRRLPQLLGTLGRGGPGWPRRPAGGLGGGGRLRRWPGRCPRDALHSLGGGRGRRTWHERAAHAPLRRITREGLRVGVSAWTATATA